MSSTFKSINYLYIFLHQLGLEPVFLYPCQGGLRCLSPAIYAMLVDESLQFNLANKSIHPVGICIWLWESLWVGNKASIVFESSWIWTISFIFLLIHYVVFDTTEVCPNILMHDASPFCIVFTLYWFDWCGNPHVNPKKSLVLERNG